nr:hypothetical protein [Tanacetum cinerariifolium]
CTCEFCGNGAHVGYNCPAQVSSFQTMPSFPQQDPCCEDCGDLPETDHCQPLRFIKSSVENLVPNPSEFEGENGCDVPACLTTFSNILFNADYKFDSSDDQSLYDEDVPEKIFSKPLFEEEIISMKIDQHHFNAESNLIESLLNHDSSIIPSSSKIDSLLDEFMVNSLFSNQFYQELKKLIVIMRMKFILS